MPDTYCQASPPARATALAHRGGSRRDTMLALIALLERERSALHAPDPDVLEALAQEKQALCQALQPPRAGLRAPASHIVLDDPETQALLRQAHHLNSTNAALLAMHRASCEARLRLLRGSNGAATVYRANGYLSL